MKIILAKTACQLTTHSQSYEQKKRFVKKISNLLQINCMVYFQKLKALLFYNNFSS